jgi:putative membrane-bound dehydrogenase-like protein
MFGIYSGRRYFLGIVLIAAISANADDFPPIFNTEKSTDKFLSPEEAVKKISLPPGFKATLFAGEPDVQQPIAITTDDRGRLWVAENYTYSENESSFDKKLRDRVVILEDINGDGHFDKRTVFWDKGQKLTSVEIGFGGAWVLCAPQLLFIPDRNGDDIPDGDEEVVLDGWNDMQIHHNIVNGLKWGPDGWLYGRHGILATSFVGQPGTPKDQRTQINCGIWRYHPTRKVFEVVASGTTNPWGMDFDEYGEGFFINTVIGHLFHLIPGAHYKRMYGEDLTPHTYELIDQHADHYHWDTGKKWTETRDNTGSNDTLGGGHAHSGLMIYLGDNWPDKYRGTLFTVNLHGYRLNNDLLQRSGSGYVGKHGEDFLKTSDKWFRAIDLIYGPDGGVYVADWSDVGECHESDGVHRSSGRIYKITYGEPRKSKPTDVSKLSNAELVKFQLHKNDWFVRHARRVLQERAAAGKDAGGAHAELRRIFERNPDTTRKLRALWTLYVTEGASEPWLLSQLDHPDEHVRAWVVRLLTDKFTDNAEVIAKLSALAGEEPSSLVRLSIASALQKIPVSSRAAVASGLLSHAENAGDHNLPDMIWYGVEPIVAAEREQAVALAKASAIPLTRQFIARRMAEDFSKQPFYSDVLVKLASERDEAFQLDIVQGISDALKGWRRAVRPKSWPALQDAVAKSSNEKLKNAVRDLSLLFGDDKVVGELRSAVLNDSASKETRRAALQKLIENKSENLLPFLETLLANKLVASVAMRGLAVYDAPKAAEMILAHYDELPPEDRADGIATLASRPAYAQKLLDAVASGKIKRGDISAYHARQIRSLNNADLDKKLSEVWGEIRGTGNEKKQVIANFKAKLTPDVLKKANAAKGHELFGLTCALCHTLYGEGAKIGPDLTGSGRQNLDYLLENIVDPSAIVGADFKMAVVTLKDGRVLNGIISEKTERTLAVQSFTEKVTLERADISEIKDSAVSLMPEGMLESLDEAQVANLIAYLMSSEPPRAAKP